MLLREASLDGSLADGGYDQDCLGFLDSYDALRYAKLRHHRGELLDLDSSLALHKVVTMELDDVRTLRVVDYLEEGVIFGGEVRKSRRRVSIRVGGVDLVRKRDGVDLGGGKSIESDGTIETLLKSVGGGDAQLNRSALLSRDVNELAKNTRTYARLFVGATRGGVARSMRGGRRD